MAQSLTLLHLYRLKSNSLGCPSLDGNARYCGVVQKRCTYIRKGANGRWLESPGGAKQAHPHRLEIVLQRHEPQRLTIGRCTEIRAGIRNGKPETIADKRVDHGHILCTLNHIRAKPGLFEQRLQKEGQLRYLTFPVGVVASEGGVPIKRDGKTVGAVGVSGATSQEDGLIAAAGIAALEAALAPKK